MSWNPKTNSKQRAVFWHCSTWNMPSLRPTVHLPQANLAYCKSFHIWWSSPTFQLVNCPLYFATRALMNVYFTELPLLMALGYSHVDQDSANESGNALNHVMHLTVIAPKEILRDTHTQTPQEYVHDGLLLLRGWVEKNASWSRTAGQQLKQPMITLVVRDNGVNSRTVCR